MKKMFNEGNQIHNFMSSSGSGTVINYGSDSGSDFLTSYGSGYGSGSTTLLYTSSKGRWVLYLVYLYYSIIHVINTNVKILTR